MVRFLDSISDKALPSLLQDGAVGVLPTDTLYGLVCAAKNEESVKRLYALKSRERKPGTIIAANIDQLIDLGVKARYLKAVQHFWPGAISVVIPIPAELDYLHAGAQSLPVRIPDNPELLHLLKEIGPLITTSANMPDKKPAATLAEAKNIFGDSVDFYVEGGDFSNREPSTIIRIVDDAIEILREGAVKIDESGNTL